MQSSQLFARAVALLPDPVRERLNGESALDWETLEHESMARALDDVAARPRRLPEAVEALARRLIRDIGIVPADLAAGAERRGAASAWIEWVALESEGETYRIRNDRSGEVHDGIRPEAIVGYATLGMELATAAHCAGERWLEAGDRHAATPAEERNEVARCSVRMSEHMRAAADGTEGRPATAARIAGAFERAWNGQNDEARETLAGTRLSTALGARAPRRNRYVPAASHRLLACDVGEMRWLWALAERAAARDRRPVDAAAKADGDAPVVRTATPLALGSDPETLTFETEFAELARAAAHLPGAVKHRLGEAYGAGIARELMRLETPEEEARLREELRDAAPNAPRWLEELTTALLADAGAQTREGLRTAPVRVDRPAAPGRGYRATESETGAVAVLAPIALIEQARLGLLFVRAASEALATLQSTGKEGDWMLGEADRGNGDLSAGERDSLEAAQEIGQALDRLGHAFAETHGARAPNALQEAAMAASALDAVGPTLRVAAGWPGAAGPPDARNPHDVARIASVAEALHREIRAGSNRLIAGWIADVHA